MREILFKAKRLNNGEWVEGNLITNERNENQKYIGYIFDERNGVIEDFDIVEVMPYTICQYTGLTDENGKKIWENDIVEIPSEDGYFKCEWEEDTVKFVFNGNGLTVDFDNYWAYEVEVIGNIFDNPELLEVER